MLLARLTVRLQSATLATSLRPVRTNPAGAHTVFALAVDSAFLALLLVTCSTTQD